MFSPVYFLAISLLLFSCGVTVVLIKRNAIIILIGIELMLNATNLNFVGFNQLYPQSQHGQVFTLFVIVVAAAEAAVALAIILKVYQFYQTADPDDIHELKDK